MEKFSIILIVYLLPTMLYASNVDFGERLPTFENPSCDNESVTVDFSNSVIYKIGPNFIKSPEIMCLKIVNNEVNEIDENAFAMLPNLKILDLQANKLSTARFLALRTHLNLTWLSLANQECTYYNTIRTAINYMYPKLTSLNISGNCIAELYSKYYDVNMFPSLMHLDLSNNNLKMFNNVQLISSNLSILYLNNNNLRSFFMSHLLNLEVLNLENNKLNELVYSGSYYYNSNSVSLKNLYSLRYLSLAYNNIRTIRHGTFVDCSLLETLNLSHNKIDETPALIFDKLISLKYLYLNNNELRVIPQIRNTLNNMLRLDLDYNMIKSINSSSFSHLPNLIVLSLANNDITLVDPTSFANLTKLEYLNLSVNRLESLPDTWCASLISLKYLYLSNNHFTTLEQLSLIPDLNLVDLYLYDNVLTTLKATSFQSLPVDVTVHMRNNTILSNSSSEDLDLNPYG